MSTIKDPEHSEDYIISPIGTILVETQNDNKLIEPSTSSYYTPKIISAKRALFMSESIKSNLGKSIHFSY